MEEKAIQLLKKLRRYLFKYGLEESSLEKLKQNGIIVKDVVNHFGSFENLVNKLLEDERDAFEGIFRKYDFEGMNAIDILLIVSKEIDKRFYNMNPFITVQLKERFPNVYDKHIESRLDFIYNKIQINLTKGISQGMYRNDISIEMIARMYIAKLKDIHNLEIFSPEKSGFATVFNALIDDFVKGIANKEGLKYYKQRKQLLGVLSFGH